MRIGVIVSIAGVVLVTVLFGTVLILDNGGTPDCPTYEVTVTEPSPPSDTTPRTEYIMMSIEQQDAFLMALISPNNTTEISKPVFEHPVKLRYNSTWYRVNQTLVSGTPGACTPQEKMGDGGSLGLKIIASIIIVSVGIAGRRYYHKYNQ